MVISVKLYSVFRLRYPDYDCDRGIVFKSDTEVTLADILKMLDINPAEVALIFVKRGK